MNDRWCVRCTKESGTPYLRKVVAGLKELKPSFVPHYTVLDIGCGNGRNTEYLIEEGFTETNILPLDMCPDYGYAIKLGKERFPVFNHSVNIVLANYVFMFLSKKELDKTLREIDRVGSMGCRLVVELYPAKDSFTPDNNQLQLLKHHIVGKLKKNWTATHVLKERMTLHKERK